MISPPFEDYAMFETLTNNVEQAESGNSAETLCELAPTQIGFDRRWLWHRALRVNVL